MNSLLDKKEQEAWNNFLQALEDNLPGFVKPWINSLEPALPLFEESENGIFLIKSNQSFGIQVLQQKHIKDSNFEIGACFLRKYLKLNFKYASFASNFFFILQRTCSISVETNASF